MEIKRIGVLSAAKIFGAIYAVLGLIIAFIYACAGLAVVAGALAESDAGFLGLGVGAILGALCLVPLFYGIIGFVAGAIGAALYNVLAGAIGGLELDLAEKM